MKALALPTSLQGQYIKMIYHDDMSRTPILFAVLGMLKLRPMTGYEIRQVYQKGPANFMPISFGQIYPVLAKLRQDKMVRQDKQQGGRGSIRYFITHKGAEAFRKWLSSPSDPGNHRELLLRLFFATPPEMAELRGHVEVFRREQQAVSSTTKTRASGWTTPRSTIHDYRSGSWSWSTAFCSVSPACAGQNERWRS